MIFLINRMDDHTTIIHAYPDSWRQAVDDLRLRLEMKGHTNVFTLEASSEDAVRKAHGAVFDACRRVRLKRIN